MAKARFVSYRYFFIMLFILFEGPKASGGEITRFYDLSIGGAIYDKRLSLIVITVFVMHHRVRCCSLINIYDQQHIRWTNLNINRWSGLWCWAWQLNLRLITSISLNFRNDCSYNNGFQFLITHCTLYTGLTIAQHLRFHFMGCLIGAQLMIFMRALCN